MDILLTMLAHVLSAMPDGVRFDLMDSGLLDPIATIVRACGWVFFEDGTIAPR